MIQEKTSVHIQFFIVEFICFLADILALKHRNAFGCFRIFLSFLICLKILCALYHLLFFFLGKSIQVVSKFVLQGFCLSCSKTSGWYKGQYRSVWIIEEIFPDQFFEVSCVLEGFQLLKYRDQFYLCKWMFIVIEPVAKDIESIDQPLRIGREICLSVAEFHAVDSGFQSFLVNSGCDDILKDFADNGNKFVFFVRICALCDNVKIWLTDTIFISTIDILTDTSVKKCLLERCARCT